MIATIVQIVWFLSLGRTAIVGWLFVAAFARTVAFVVARISFGGRLSWGRFFGGFLVVLFFLLPFVVGLFC